MMIFCSIFNIDCLKHLAFPIMRCIIVEQGIKNHFHKRVYNTRRLFSLHIYRKTLLRHVQSSDNLLEIAKNSEILATGGKSILEFWHRARVHISTSNKYHLIKTPPKHNRKLSGGREKLR